MKLKGFKNSNIYVHRQGIVKSSLSVIDGKIAKIDPGIAEDGLLELDDKYIVLPGFIDKHIHGANSSDFMNPSSKDIQNILSAVVKEGTTSVLATTMTQDIQIIEACLKNIASYIEKQPSGTEILGIHLEGPFISPKHAGAQPEQYIIPCNVDTFHQLNQAARGHIKQVTIAYEEQGSALAKYLKENEHLKGG